MTTNPRTATEHPNLGQGLSEDLCWHDRKRASCLQPQKRFSIERVSLIRMAPAVQRRCLRGGPAVFLSGRRRQRGPNLARYCVAGGNPGISTSVSGLLPSAMRCQRRTASGDALWVWQHPEPVRDDRVGDQIGNRSRAHSRVVRPHLMGAHHLGGQRWGSNDAWSSSASAVTASRHRRLACAGHRDCCSRACRVVVGANTGGTDVSPAADSRLGRKVRSLGPRRRRAGAREEEKAGRWVAECCFRD